MAMAFDLRLTLKVKEKYLDPFHICAKLALT